MIRSFWGWLLALLVIVTFTVLGWAWFSTAHAQQVAPDGSPNAIACAYNQNPFTIATGNSGRVQCDINGNLIVSFSSTSTTAVTQAPASTPWNDNITQWASTTLGAPTPYGTAPTGNAPGVNAAITNPLPAGTNNLGLVSLTATNSGLALHNQTSSLASGLVLKAANTNLYNVSATAIAGNAAGYLVVINAATIPTSGTAITPLDACYIPASSAIGCSISHGVFPIGYTTGAVALITTATSPFTYTSGTDTGFISGDYR